MTLGGYGILTVEEARVKPKKQLTSVLSGGDPLGDRKEATKGETVKDLCLAYIERHAKPHKKSWAEDEKKLNRRIIPRWGNIKASAIKRSDVAALHTEIGREGHKYEANRIIALLSKMFEMARRWGFVPDGHINPVRDIDHFREEKRDRWVTPEELPHLIKAMNEEPNIYARYALWLCLLTGARKGEVLKARWSDMDFQRRELKLPETKAGRVHYLPLSSEAMEVLQQIPREPNNAYIFPGREKGAHLVNLNKPWRRVRANATLAYWESLNDEQITNLASRLGKQLDRKPTYAEIKAGAGFDLPTGLVDVRLHDLRRTVGSWLAQAGNSLHLIGKVLNHSNQSTTAIYARFAQDQVRDAMEQHGKRIMGVAGTHPTAEIVSIKR